MYTLLVWYHTIFIALPQTLDPEAPSTVFLVRQHSNETLRPILDYKASWPHQTKNNLVIFMNMVVIVKLELTLLPA